MPMPARAMVSTWKAASAPSAPESAASTSIAYAETTRNANAQKRTGNPLDRTDIVPVEEDDFDMISLD